MCGICGLAARPGAPAPDGAVLRRMNASIAHRGPDADGFWEDGGVALGQRRLSIIDVAGGDNPLHDRDRRLALMYNGEVYNHLALRRELEAAGHRPLSGSDGEVVLHGYRQWGLTGMLSRLRGMYAFALHDRDTGELHLARDPLGIKPLHLALTPQGLVFGSEVKAVLAGLGARPRLDPRALFQCATLGFVLAPRTIWQGVESLPPGGWATWRSGELRRGRHFELRWEPGRETADPEALWARLSDAVSSHLMSEVPLGAF
ncbi:MAG TPA: asparagine synthetase B, partial [Planctomycetota bacterium]|nr:asparagine synthetase B [Planctomycetota bacterium]